MSRRNGSDIENKTLISRDFCREEKETRCMANLKAGLSVLKFKEFCKVKTAMCTSSDFTEEFNKINR